MKLYNKDSVIASKNSSIYKFCRNNYKVFIKLFLFPGLVYFPVFLHLENLPLRIWDESRLAINAYEMHENSNFLVTYFKGNPDMWNTKPPLMIWFQVFFIRLFGVGELAIRLPSAIAALLTCVSIMVFSLKYLKSYWFGLFTTLVLITSNGYISIHGTRTGDYDSLLVFLLTFSTLAFFMYLQNVNNIKHLYFFITGLALAVLTKGIAGLMLTPSLVLYTVLNKRLFDILKSKHFYINLGIFIVLVLGYYFLREIKNPGFVKAVYENELGGRYMDTLEGHRHEFLIYYKNIINGRLKIWYWLVPIGVIAGFIVKDKKIRELSFFSLILVIQYFLVISFSQTKLKWYDLPLYPFLSVLISIPIYLMFNKLKNSNILNSRKVYGIVPYIFAMTVFINPYISIVNNVFKPKENHWDQEFYNISYYLKSAIKTGKDLDNYSLVYSGYNAHLCFYSKLINDSSQDFKIIAKEEIKGNEKVIADQKEIKEFIEHNFNYEIIERYENVNIYKLLENIESYE